MSGQASDSTSREIDAPQSEGAICTSPSCPALSQLAKRNLLVPCEPSRSQSHSVGAAIRALLQSPAGFRPMQALEYEPSDRTV